MLQQTATTIENVPLAERTYRIRLHVPEIAATIRPGQFVMLRLPGTTDPLLGRPFALYDTVLDESRTPVAVDVVYLVVGKMTARLANVKSSEAIEIWGPLGNGFLDFEDAEHVALVAGGIGQTPFLAYVNELLGNRGYAGDVPRRRVKSVALYYGVRTNAFAADLERFRQVGATLHLASDDGSLGHRGFVTELLALHHPPGPWIGCGPEPMLRALAKLAAERNISCHVSLETPMACGFGVCFSCATKTKTNDGWDYKRACVDGPVFRSECLVWEC